MYATAQDAAPKDSSLSGELPPEEIDPDDERPEPGQWEPTPPDAADDGEPWEIPCTDDDSSWDVFIPDDDERDPLPDPGDFWIDTSQEDEMESLEPE
jgi:hypothetical protein